MWGTATLNGNQVILMGAHGTPYQFTYSDASGASHTVTGKYAYEWYGSLKEAQEHGYLTDADGNSDRWRLGQGTLIYHDGFKVVYVSGGFENNLNQLQEAYDQNRALSLSANPTVLTPASPQSAYPSNFNVKTDNTLLYTDGAGRFWICVQDGAPGTPDSQPSRWLEITDMFASVS